MPEGKKTAVPAPKPVREEDLYSAKTHLHQPVPVQETATVSATAQLADAPEGALPSEVRPEIVTWEKLCEAIKASGRSYNMEMIEKAYNLANTAHKGVAAAASRISAIRWLWHGWCWILAWTPRALLRPCCTMWWRTLPLHWTT